MFHKTKVEKRSERLDLMLIHLAEALDCIVYLGSFTLVSSEFKAWVLFDYLGD